MGKTAGSNGAKKAPVYSADAMALRYLFGLLLLAAGIVVVLSTVVRLKGSLFDGVRVVCFGSMGVMAVVLPVFLIWAGVLAIYSAQRRSPVKPWLFALLGFIAVSGFLVLVTRYGEQSYLEHLKASSSGQWGDVIRRSYIESAQKGLKGQMLPGGAVGSAIAWPLHLYCGDFLGCLILGVLVVLCALAALSLSPAGLVRLIRNKRANGTPEERYFEEQRRLAWQQEQEMRTRRDQEIRTREQQAMKPGVQTGFIPNGYPEQTGRNVQNGPVYYGQSGISGAAEAPYNTAGATRAEDVPGGKPAERGGEKWRSTDVPPRISMPDYRRQQDDGSFTDQQLSRTGKSRAFGRPDMGGIAAPRQMQTVSAEDVNSAAHSLRREADSEKPADARVKRRTGMAAAKRAAAKAGGSAAEREDSSPASRSYTPPPMEDLSYPKAQEEDTAAEDDMRSRRLEETLASFRVQAQVVHVTHGPAISRFELELATGVKVGKVAELEKDIAYGMEAASVRIEAPIPGKSLVGVEVPNRKVAVVTLREVLDSAPMRQSKSVLTVALGKDIAGSPVVCDLARMPHMLIAGATGSGKSVCINVIINSLLYRAGPEEVKLILVDPKVVELQCYQDIPHLLIPVVNDPRKAASALAWAVAEMMERYDRFAERRVRNLEGYNAVLQPGEKPMYRIVIIIDELSDLMMACKKDVESYIVRLTQLARAAGIHLIVATQRPSVDVITGLIKANIPSRIAFKTASSVDSRTIIDRNGSEQLLGWGDMLYAPTGSFSPVRIQGCYLSDDEVNRIVAHVRESNPNEYDPNILEKLEELNREQEKPDMSVIGGAPDNDESDWALLEQCVEYALADGQISTSTLQRRLKIGYARAGRLTDMMEERGFISEKDGSKPRKCLITREEWEKIKSVPEDAGNE